MRSKLILTIALVLSLVGLGMIAGAGVSYSDGHTGTPGKVKVADCSGGYGRYASGVHCTGSWVVGGSLLGNGHVVVGTIDNAGYSDIGKTISVRLHGDHATKPSTRVPIILAVIGIWMAAAGIYFLVSWRRSGSAAPRQAPAT